MSTRSMPSSVSDGLNLTGGTAHAAPPPPGLSMDEDAVVSAPAMIRAEGLAKAYPGRGSILSALGLTVRQGERIALLGSNGTGKSTLLRCLVGLQSIDAGQVEILGERFTRSPDAGQRRRLRRGLGFVFQFHGLVQRHTALSNVIHGVLGQGAGVRAWSHRWATDRVRHEAHEALGRVGLAHLAGARADELSGGQAQRVAIARAIVHRPRLVIADEPAASLDPAAATDVMELFGALNRREGITVVFTTHAIEHALGHADRIIALADGRIVLDAPASALGSGDLEAIYRKAV